MVLETDVAVLGVLLTKRADSLLGSELGKRPGACALAHMSVV